MGKNALKELYENNKVSILIVLELPLWAVDSWGEKGLVADVSILIVLELPLWGCLDHRETLMVRSFNPYCSGITAVGG